MTYKTLKVSNLLTHYLPDTEHFTVWFFDESNASRHLCTMNVKDAIDVFGNYTVSNFYVSENDDINIEIFMSSNGRWKL